MSESKENVKQNSRMDKLLFYSKFILLIVITILFVMVYSYSYKDFPISTAQYELVERDNNPENYSKSDYPVIRALVVMDYKDYYENGAYSNFYLLNDLFDNAENLDYDLFLINDVDNYSALNNIDDSLLLRVYQNKDYQYIISIGNNAILPSKEINELFFPSSRILIFGASDTAIDNAIRSNTPAKESIINAISASTAINPTAEKIIFLCDDDKYSKTMINTINTNKEIFQGMSYEVLLSSQYSVEQVCQYINEQNNPLIFYVSFIEDKEKNVYNHSDIINEIQSTTKKLIFDLSQIIRGYNVRNSIKYWSHEIEQEPLAYVGVNPKYISTYNYELVEFAVMNIMQPGKTIEIDKIYTYSSYFVDWCMKNMGLKEFPQTLSEQINFCTNNSLFICKSDLQPGDLIFESEKANGTIKDVRGVSIYISEDAVIDFNSEGILCVTKPVDEEYQVAYAHPYSYLENAETAN